MQEDDNKGLLKNLDYIFQDHKRLNNEAVENRTINDFNNGADSFDVNNFLANKAVERSNF